VRPSELREQPLAELHRLLQQNRQELFNLRFQLVSHQLDNPMRLRRLKKEIARLLTIIGARERKG
jgi:large subunit ribosomal protein L29